MLSSENPSEPSCSSNPSPPLRSDDKASEKLGFQEPDPVESEDTPTPNFCIRDYVFTSRSKGVATSWPFGSRVLQLFVKNGVEDLLPPFEPPRLVRARSSAKAFEPHKPVICSEAAQISAHLESVEPKDGDPGDGERISGSPINGLTEERPDHAQNRLPEDNQVGSFEEITDQENEILPAVTSDDQAGRVQSKIRKPVNEIEVSEPVAPPKKLQTPPEISEKKCKLVVKLGSSSDTGRAEDLVSNSSTVSDPMASKVCPVCKVFSSTSNTTLNAHIDQCLSMESNTKEVETKLLKPRVKPRKKRLMVDVYATAAHCTLEDLDKRNGTNWAAELALLAASSDLRVESQKPDLTPAESRNVESEGAVYVDSNGIKLRILSKFNDAPPVISSEESRPGQVEMEKASKSVLISKEKHFGAKYLKAKKLKVKGKKFKFTSLKLSKARIQAKPDGDGLVDAHQKEKSLSDLPKVTGKSMSCGPATLRQWVCSKRSGLPKKPNNKDARKSSEDSAHVTRKLAVSNHIESADSHIDKGHNTKFCGSSEIAPTPPHDASPREVSPEPPVSIPKWSSKAAALPSGLRFKLSRSPGASASLPSKKTEHIGIGDVQKSHKSSVEKNFLNRSTSFSVEAQKGDLSDSPSTFRKFRKQRTVLRTGKRKTEISSDGTENTCKKPKAHQSDALESEMLAYEQREDQNNEVNPGLEAGCRDAEAEMQVEAPVSKDDVSDSSAEKIIVNDPLITESVNLETLESNLNGASGVCRSVEVQLPSLSVSKAHRETIVRGSSDKVIPEETHVYKDLELGAEEESCASLTSHGNMSLETPQDSNSSITSNREASNQDHSLAADGEPAESPVSTASTLSLHSSKDSKFKELESNPFTKSAGIQDNAGLTLPSGETVRVTEGTVERIINQEAKAVLPSKEHEQSSIEKPCCCSCGESLFKESHTLRQSPAALGTTLTSKGKQVPRLYIGLRSSSSFSSYQSLRSSNTLANLSFNSANQSVSAKGSSESALNVSACIEASSNSPSCQTQLPSPSNPILRLMGKNLLVVNKDETLQPQTPNSEFIYNMNYMSPLGFAPSVGSLKSENFQYYNMGGSAVSSQAPLMSAWAQSQNNFLAQPYRNSLQKPYEELRAPSRVPSTMQEVIVIDDPPEAAERPKGSFVMTQTASPQAAFSAANPVPARSFPVFPNQNQFVFRDASGAPRPLLPNFYPRVSASLVMPGSTSEGQSAFVPTPFMFQPPTGHPSPSIYYSQTLH
uniref:Hapless 8 n=1 Tax=Ananas comosus var. bracteatus TaxID=296719 RepID=A0A6V7QW62_ANACO